MVNRMAPITFKLKVVGLYLLRDCTKVLSEAGTARSYGMPAGEHNTTLCDLHRDK